MGIERPLRGLLCRLRRNTKGLTTIEYALLLVLVIFGALAVISLIGSFLSNSIQLTTDSIPGNVDESELVSRYQGHSRPEKPDKPDNQQRLDNLNRIAGPKRRYIIVAAVTLGSLLGGGSIWLRRRWWVRPR